MSSLGPTDHEPSALLSDDTLSALQLREQPFLRPETSEDTFSDEVTTDQLADIKQALITGDDLLLILGEPGIGKSTLLAQLGDNSGLRIQCFSVEGSARFSAVNLFGGMLEAFKREPPDNLKTMLDELIPCLQGMISNNTLSAVVIDNADAVDAVEMTRLLSAMLYMNNQDETLMRIALSAPPEFEARIPELLPEGADLPYSTLTIEPFEHERCADYLAWRFERAGEASGIPFDEAQIVDMNGRAEGNPRRLHEIVADELNLLHGELEPAIPPELLASSRSESGSLGATLLGGRSPKILLGGLGILLISLGLLLFLPGGDEEGDGFAVVEQRKLDDQNAERLALVDEEPSAVESPAPEAPAPELIITESPTPGSQTSDAVVDPPDSPSEVTDGLDEPLPEGGVDAESDGASEDASARAAPDQTSQDRDDANRETATVIEDREDSLDSEGIEFVEESPSDDVAGAEDEIEIQIDPTPASEGRNTEAAADASAVTEAVSEPAVSESDSESSRGTENEVSVDPAPDERPDEQAPTPPESDELADALDVPESGSQMEPPATVEPTPETSATDPNPVSDPSTPSADDGMESPNWILTQNPDIYTIQMIASTSRREVEIFLTDANLKGPNSIFTFQRGGVDWYALVHGLYESVEEARSAIIRMPDAALSFQPWIRSIGRVQNSLRK